MHVIISPHIYAPYSTCLPSSSRLPVPSLQLHILIHQPHLLPILKSGEPDIRASIAAERVPQCTVPTAAHFPLDGEIDFCELVGFELRCCGGVGGVGRFGGGRRVEFRQRSVGVGALGGVFGCDAGGEAAGAVFASAAALSARGAAFGRCCASFVS